MPEPGGLAPGGEDRDGDGAQKVWTADRSGPRPPSRRSNGLDCGSPVGVKLTEEDDDETRVGSLEVEEGGAESTERKCGDSHVGREPERARVEVVTVDTRA